MASFGLDVLLQNLDNPNVQNLVKNSPDVQKQLDRMREDSLAALKVAHPQGDPNAGTIVAVDLGIHGDVAEGSILSLLLSHAEPRAAAGAAVFGLGLVALPLIAGIHDVDNGLEVERVGIKEAAGFTYESCQRTREDEDMEKPLPEADLKSRLGPLDPVGLATEILRTEAESSSHSRCSEDETGRVQQCILSAKVAVRRLRRRSALAFMGLRVGSSAEEVQQKYKRMALEMHPDKGGDAEQFQQLQDMRQRLTKSIQEEEDEDAKRRAEEDEHNKNLPPTARAKQLRREAHAEAVKLWEVAREAEAEMLTDKGMLKGDPGPVLARLRSFVEQFSNSQIRMLPHGNKEMAKRALWRFKAEGLELIAAAALVDPAATSNLIATHINYKVVARSGSKEVAADAQALLTAVANVQQRVDNFLMQMGREREETQNYVDAEKADEESSGGPFRSGEEVLLVGPDFEEDEGKRAFVLGNHEGGYSVRLASGRRITVSRKQLLRAPAASAEEAASTEASEDARNGHVSNIPQAPPILVTSEPELPPDPEREDWVADFTHPYVGAMDGDGNGIFCRACCRWITTRRFAHEPFLRHTKAAHRSPPLGWKGSVPTTEET